ncbi:solute carrier family 46 member 3 [Patella vulgata]|uniref:solute carrier family 46 member 3 n=1 Tax=Patella vulgata TaxID=6465 RepID=UPI0024A9748C|nr:solute carrier family 46 member 3 [Patella vulgata]
MENQEEELSPSSSKLPSNFPYIRAWLVSGISLVLYTVAGITISPVITQYVEAKLREEVFGSSKYNGTLRTCGNSTLTKNNQLEQRIQEEVSSLTLYFALVGNSAAFFMSIFLGPLSDSLGRKIIFLIPMFGLLVKSLIITFIVYFKLNIYYMYLAYGLDGLSGKNFVILVATFAYSVDVAKPGRSRTIAITIMESCMALAAGLGQLGTGYLIRSTGFFYTLVMFDIISALEIVIIFFLLPETVTNKQWRDKSVLGSIKKVFGFYFTEGTLHDKLCYLIALGTFFFGVVTTLGRTTLETIYQLGEPFCWDSVKIGYYGAFRLTALVLFSTAAVKLLQPYFRDETIAIISTISAIAGLVFEGVINTSWLMYLVPVLGALGGAAIPISRAIMSEMTLPSRQGKLLYSIYQPEVIFKY